MNVQYNTFPKMDIQYPPQSLIVLMPSRYEKWMGFVFLPGHIAYMYSSNYSRPIHQPAPSEATVGPAYLSMLGHCHHIQLLGYCRAQRQGW